MKQGEGHWGGRTSLLMFCFFALSILFPGCGSGGGGNGGPPDTTPPTVTSTSPADDETDVAIDSTLGVTFSEPMDPDTLTTDSFIVEGSVVPGTLEYSDHTATFTPSNPLAFSATHTVTLTTEIKDLAGNPLEEAFIFSFTTGDEPDTVPPSVLSTIPENGTVDVSLKINVKATFSEAMKPATLSTSTFVLKDPSNNLVSGTVQYGGTSAIFHPLSDLLSNTTYTATITTEAEDLAGNALTTDHIWSFTTFNPPGPMAAVSIVGHQTNCQMAYEPNPLNISAGTTVAWTNNTNLAHTVTSSDGNDCHPGSALPTAERVLDFGVISPGATVSHTFDTPGTYEYVCNITTHQMRGTVIVGP